MKAKYIVFEKQITAKHFTAALLRELVVSRDWARKYNDLVIDNTQGGWRVSFKPDTNQQSAKFKAFTAGYVAARHQTK